MNILSYAQIKYGLNTLHLYRFTHTLHTWGFIYLFIFFEEVSDDYPDELEKTIKNQKHTHSHTNHSTLCLAAVLYLRTGICGGGLTSLNLIMCDYWYEYFCAIVISFLSHLILVFQPYLCFFFPAFFFFPLAGGSRELTMHFTLNWEYVAMVVARDLA